MQIQSEDLEFLKHVKTFLDQHNIYQCLPQNSQMIFLDYSLSPYDIIQILNENNQDSAILWSTEDQNLKNIFNYNTLLEILLNLIKQQKAQNKLIEENDFENLQDFDYNKISELNCQEIVQQLKQIKIKDQYFYDFQDKYSIVNIETQKSILEGCQKMCNQKLNRIQVNNQDNNLIVGEISFRDIMLYIIKNLQQDENIGKVTLNLGSQQKIISVNQKDKVIHAFHQLQKSALSSIPICGENEQFQGFILQSDLKFILQNDRYDFFFQDCEQFLKFLKQEKSQILATNFYENHLFNPNDSLQIVIEKLIFQEGERLVQLDQQGKIIRIITLTDIFEQYLQQ